MNEKEKSLTQIKLKQILDYDSSTGAFTWKISPKFKVDFVGKQAGGLHHRGYRYIKINGKNYSEHRLAWLYVYGEILFPVVDHINGVCSDNRIINLRNCTQKENIRNQKVRSSNTSGFKGVSFNAKLQKYTAKISIDGEGIYLGLFLTPEAASAAYIEKAKELYGDYYRDVDLTNKRSN